MPNQFNTPYLEYKNDVLHFDGYSLAQLAATYTTPLFVYSKAAILQALAAYQQGIGSDNAQIMYSVKANSNLAILQLLQRQGCSFDIVSAGELQRVLAVGADASKIAFSGVGKTAAEMRLALEAGIGCFNVESIAELQQLNAVATAMAVKAPISLRINPDVDAKTHPYISTGLKNNKFGIAHQDCVQLYQRAQQMAAIRIVGIDCHIGSQIIQLEPFLEAAEKVLQLVEQLAQVGIELEHVDFGGGLGIRYEDEQPVPAQVLCEKVIALVKQRVGRQCKVLFEPGRSIVGNAGICLTEVLYLKPTEAKNFAIVDAAMNDLPRPSMYQAYHAIVPVQRRDAALAANYDVVGPICESGDWLGRNRELAIAQGDYLAVASAGAYCMSMASNYNARGRAAELLITEQGAQLIRQRESLAQQISNELLLD